MTSLINTLLVVLSLLLSSCAPTPGNTLQKGVTHETPLAKMALIVHKGNFITTSVACHKATWPYKPWLSVASIFLNFGIVPACCMVEYDGSGGVRGCEVWYSGFDFQLQHELRHCMGYK